MSVVLSVNASYVAGTGETKVLLLWVLLFAMYEILTKACLPSAWRLTAGPLLPRLHPSCPWGLRTKMGSDVVRPPR